MRHYETTFVVDAHLQDEAIEKSVDKFLKFIEKSGGKLGLVDRWGKRRLAYEIKKKQYGFYVCARYEAEGTIIQGLEREFQLDEDILRSLTIQVPKSVLKEEKENPQAITMVKPTDDNAITDKKGIKEVKPEVEPVVETKVEPEIETKVEPEIETKVEAEVEVEVEPEIETKVEAEVEVEVEPEIETKVEGEVEVEVEEKVEEETAEPQDTIQEEADASEAEKDAAAPDNETA